MKKINQDILQRKITDRQNGLLESGHVGRCEIIVNQEGKTIFHKSFGCEQNLVYRLASMTKPVTAVAVLSEVQRGHISLDEKVSKYFKGFKNKYVGMLDENGKPAPKEKAKTEITIKQLLNHTNGLLSDIGGVCYPQELTETQQDRENLTTISNFIENKVLLSFQPGETAFYSATAAFDIAARIVEMTSSMAYNEYVDEFIFKPLGITDITFVPTEEQWQRMSLMHSLEDGKVHYSDPGKTIFEGFPLTYFCGGAGLCGTAAAYSVFAEMLLNDGGNVLKPEMVKLMQTPTVPISWNPEDSQWWGLGVRVIENDNYILPKGCFGWSGAYGSHFWVDPANRITAVYMKNSRYDGGAGAQTSNWFEEDVVNSLQ